MFGQCNDQLTQLQHHHSPLVDASLYVLSWPNVCVCQTNDFRPKVMVSKVTLGQTTIKFFCNFYLQWWSVSKMSAFTIQQTDISPMRCLVNTAAAATSSLLISRYIILDTKSWPNVFQTISFWPKDKHPKLKLNETTIKLCTSVTYSAGLSV